MSAPGFSYSFNPSACDECKGKCCTGESGYIWIKDSDISQIAKHLGLSTKALIDEFCEVYKNRISIKEKPYKDGFACIFFDENINGCGIYPARPEQCRSFPFWDYFKSHKYELKKECIGVIFNNKEMA
ncbi:YkgJ family cysteine cluster protein [Campylobacter sp. 19-13652]|uniref:YkgJ family cysteine cluster protein n=1 Tax=Campylobacter sp. 19-13652 TaxID=2840180 RepID=UPI0021A412BA|nr:YkgJ family cysteine cluster protein [Campylobacter sp. 19-13652]